MERVPFVLLGDGPTTHSGLGRIATDLAGRLWAERDALGVDLLQIGYPDAGDDREGIADAYTDWPLYLFGKLTDWGRGPLQRAYRWFGRRPGVLLTVWDPSRCLALLEPGVPVERWGYFAVDAENLHGGISGPAGDVVAGYDRVLAYTEFGARVLASRRGGEAVPSLPHGVDFDTFTVERTPEQLARTAQLLGGYVLPETIVIGCVATNMRRKDLGLFFQTLQILRTTFGLPVHGWLHTNKEISEAWSVPQLAIDTEIGTALTVTLSLTDEELAGLYTRCAVTIAPGLGEGFGYPIVESQACGTPCVAVNYAGGAALTRRRWRVEPAMYRLEGPYALRRPVVDPAEMARVVAAELTREGEAILSRTEVREWVRVFEWPTIWPAWRQWVQDGLHRWRAR